MKKNPDSLSSVCTGFIQKFFSISNVSGLKFAINRVTDILQNYVSHQREFMMSVVQYVK